MKIDLKKLVFGLLPLAIAVFPQVKAAVQDAKKPAS